MYETCVGEIEKEPVAALEIGNCSAENESGEWMVDAREFPDLAAKSSVQTAEISRMMEDFAALVSRRN